MPVALPSDLGYFGQEGKYTPWSDAGNQEQFQADLKEILTRALNGDSLEEYSRAAAVSDPVTTVLPDLELLTIGGDRLRLATLPGPVVLEFWAIWCPPCRRTLPELSELARELGERASVLAVCLDSRPDEVRELASRLAPGVPVALATDELLQSFGGIRQVPTLLLFDRDHRLDRVFLGAPTGLKSSLRRRIEELLEEPRR